MSIFWFDLEVVFIIASKHFYEFYPFVYEYKHGILSTKKVAASYLSYTNFAFIVAFALNLDI